MRMHPKRKRRPAYKPYIPEELMLIALKKVLNKEPGKYPVLTEKVNAAVQAKCTNNPILNFIDSKINKRENNSKP